MKILSMTATFGCLDGASLTLHDGVNLLVLPNESGKSTWSAFLTAMFYGIDTTERAAAGRIPSKRRYQPWNGKPMEGILELEQDGRIIVLQRTSQRGRPMGDFRAYDRQTGLELPELTAENCGQMLLGVERSVFLRTAFLSGTELAVSEEQRLSRRLENLAAGSDGTDSYPLADQRLKQWKNRIRYHQTGQLPQTEEALRQVQTQLDSIVPEAACPAEKPDEILSRAQADLAEYRRLTANFGTGWLMAAAFFALLVVLGTLLLTAWSALLLLPVAVSVLLQHRRRQKNKSAAREILARYGIADPSQLLPTAVAQRDALLSQGDRAALEAEKEKLEEKLAELRRREDAITMAQAALEQAHRTLAQTYAPQLTGMAGQYLIALTHGRYDGLILQRGMELLVREGKTGLTHPVAMLSRGTQDQIWLSIRLAMTNLLLPPHTPVVLDDALLTFDEARTASALEVLRAEDRQVLLFSCHAL